MTQAIVDHLTAGQPNDRIVIAPDNGVVVTLTNNPSFVSHVLITSAAHSSGVAAGPDYRETSLPFVGAVLTGEPEGAIVHHGLVHNESARPPVIQEQVVVTNGHETVNVVATTDRTGLTPTGRAMASLVAFIASGGLSQ